MELSVTLVVEIIVNRPRERLFSKIYDIEELDP